MEANESTPKARVIFVSESSKRNKEEGSFRENSNEGSSVQQEKHSAAETDAKGARVCVH